MSFWKGLYREWYWSNGDRYFFFQLDWAVVIRVVVTDFYIFHVDFEYKNNDLNFIVIDLRNIIDHWLLI